MNLNLLSKASSVLVNTAAKQGLFLRAKSPTILLFGGIIGVGTGAYLMHRAGMKYEHIIQSYNLQLDKVHKVKDLVESGQLNPEGGYTEDDYNRDIFMIYYKRTFELVKIYFPAIAATAIGVACFIGSNRILDTRLAGMAAAYQALEKGFDYYRSNVIQKYGQDEDYKLKHGVTEETVTETVVDEETGKKKKVKAVKQHYNPLGVSQYARFFDEYSPRWGKTAQYNYAFLWTMQNAANDELRRKGTLFLNEVYDMLGIPRSKAGCVVGWAYDTNGDAYVDFDILNPRNADFVNGYERSVLLDFNVQGPIWNELQ